MIRPCLFNDDLSHNFDKSVEIAERLGVGYLKLRNVNGKRISHITAQDVKDIKEVLKNTSVKLSCIGSPAFSKGCEIADEEMYKEQRRVLDTLFILCQELELDKVRVFGFDKPKGEFKKHHLNDYFEQIVEKYLEPVRLAEKAGVTLMLEPEHETYLGTSEELSRMVKALDSKNVRICWDVSNAWNAGDKPYPEGYEFVKDYIVHVHVKDAKIDPVTRTVASDRITIGTGGIPWVDIFARLHKDGYDGEATIECPFAPWTAELRPYLMEAITADVVGLHAILDKAGVPRA